LAEETRIQNAENHELMQVTDAKEKIPTVSQTFNIEKKG
jgi:hypothetical protein